MTPTKVERRNSKPKIKWADDDRRKQSEFRVRLGSHLATGWLCFETHGEKRRLAPIPDDWESLPDTALCDLCERAFPAHSRRR